MYYKHRYNLIRFDLSTSGTAYKLFIKSLYDYVIVKEVTVSDVTVRSYFIAAKDLETSWSNRASLTYSTDIKGRKLLNEGQDWLLAAIGRITELKAGVNYKVEDYPLNWIDGTYYSTYKDNTFQVSSIENVKSEADYAAVTTIDLRSQSLTTDFTATLLKKFVNLYSINLDYNTVNVFDCQFNNNLVLLSIAGHSLTNLNVSNNLLIRDLNIPIGSLTSLDLEFNSDLESLFVHYNSLSIITLPIQSSLDIANLSFNQLTDIDLSTQHLLTTLIIQNNQLDELVNSQMLIDLDSNGLSNGYLQSSIFGGGSLTAAGQTAKINLLSKGWTIVGI